MEDPKLAQFGENARSSSPKARNGWLYFLVGGGIGAAVALLFAPKAGAELRDDISEITRKKYDGTLEMANSLKDRTTDFYQAAKEKTDKVYDFAANKLGRAQNQVSEAVDTTTDRVNGEILELDSRTIQKHAGTGRRSSNIL